jgi:hypothetical protein
MGSIFLGRYICNEFNVLETKMVIVVLEDHSLVKEGGTCIFPPHSSYIYIYITHGNLQ